MTNLIMSRQLSTIVIIIMIIPIIAFADSHSAAAASSAQTVARNVCQDLSFGISAHDNDFIKDLGFVSGIRTMAELKTFISRHKAEVLINMQILENRRLDSSTPDSEEYRAELAEYRTQYIETHLSIWIAMENKRPKNPYIRGGKPTFNATTLEGLAQDYSSQKYKGSTLLSQAIKTIGSTEELVKMIEKGLLDSDFENAKSIVTDWVVVFRVRHLLQMFEQTLIAVEAPIAPQATEPASTP